MSLPVHQQSREITAKQGRKNKPQHQIHLEISESEGERRVSNKLLLPGADIDFPSKQTWELSVDFANQESVLQMRETRRPAVTAASCQRHEEYP